MKKHGDTNFEVVIEMENEKIPEFSAGSKMFISPRLYRFMNTSMPATENRRLDYYFNNPYIQSDTTYFVLPEGFTIENLPKTRNLSYEFGSFNSNYVFDEKQHRVISTATLILKQHRIPAAKFAETRKFYSDVLEEFTDKIVVKRQ